MCARASIAVCHLPRPTPSVQSISARAESGSSGRIENRSSARPSFVNPCAYRCAPKSVEIVIVVSPLAASREIVRAHDGARRSTVGETGKGAGAANKARAAGDDNRGTGKRNAVFAPQKTRNRARSGAGQTSGQYALDNANRMRPPTAKRCPISRMRIFAT